MLTRELAIAHCDWQHGSVIPDRLTRQSHADYRRYASEMFEIYREGIGKTRQELHRKVHQVFASVDLCPIRRIDAFCKLLDEGAQFDNGGRRSAANLRQKVFRLAAPHHPLVQSSDGLFQSDEKQVKQSIAQELGRSWEEIERELFADVMEFHRLQSFTGYSAPEQLLSRYNVAQCQAVLYDATQLTIWAQADFKRIIQAVKRNRLMHDFTRLSDGRYRMVLDGPASVLRHTQRYGVAMARFLPSLLACRDWQLHAKIQARRWTMPLAFRLSSTDGLHAVAEEEAGEFDSNVEREFASKWGAEARDGWTLLREDEILHRHQRVFIPDFTLQHVDGRRVLMEVVGFWTPEYLAAKATTLREFSDVPILLVIEHQAKEKIPLQPHAHTIFYKTTIRPKDVLEAIARVSGDASSETRAPS